MVPPDSHRISRVPRYSGTPSRKTHSFRLQDYHLLRLRFPADSTMNEFCNFPRRLQPSPIEPHNPEHATLAGYHAYPVWALPLSLATTQGIAVAFFSCRYLDVSVPCVCFLRLWIQRKMTRHDTSRVSPFRDLWI